MDIIMCDTRPIDTNMGSYPNLCAYATYLTCKQKGYNFTYYVPKSFTNPKVACFDPNNNEQRHPSWAKMLGVYTHLTTTNCESVMYLDTDCVLLPSCNLDQTFTGEINFGSDRPWTPGVPCAGFFSVRNTSNSLDFLERWYKTSSPESNMVNLWEQRALWKCWKTANITVENNYQYFLEGRVQDEPPVVLEPRDIYSSDIHHLAKCSFNKKGYYVKFIENHIKNYYNFDDFNSTVMSIPVITFDTDKYNTLSSWRS
jgi:hypothetical protein